MISFKKLMSFFLHAQGKRRSHLDRECKKSSLKLTREEKKVRGVSFFE